MYQGVVVSCDPERFYICNSFYSLNQKDFYSAHVSAEPWDGRYVVANRWFDRPVTFEHIRELANGLTVLFESGNLDGLMEPVKC